MKRKNKNNSKFRKVVVKIDSCGRCLPAYIWEIRFFPYLKHNLNHANRTLLKYFGVNEDNDNVDANEIDLMMWYHLFVWGLEFPIRVMHVQYVISQFLEQITIMSKMSSFGNFPFMKTPLIWNFAKTSKIWVEKISSAMAKSHVLQGLAMRN